MRKKQFNGVESETLRAPELNGEKREKNHSRREKKVRGSRELERELESSSSALLEETANCCSLSKKTQYLFLFLWRFIVDQDILLSEH